MKKVFFLLLLAVSFCMSAFAECTLDQNRWKYLYSTDECGYYFDTLTVNMDKVNSSFDVWECNYFPGNVSACSWPVCKEKGVSSTEHYHYTLTTYDYKNRTMIFKSFIARDSNGKIIFTYDQPSYLQKPNRIAPDTIGEMNILLIKKYFDEPATAQPERKKEQPLPSIVIDNIKKGEVQKLFLQRFREMAESPKMASLNPVLLEENEKITLKWAIKNEKDQASLEQFLTVFTIQQGKNVLLKGETASQLRFVDGTIKGPYRLTEFDEKLYLGFIDVKKYYNGYYRFGFYTEKDPEGYAIKTVDSGFPFAKNGIKTGDIIVSINGTALKEVSPLEIDIKLLKPFSPDAVDFVIKRNGNTKQYSVKPKYVFPEEIQNSIL